MLQSFLIPAAVTSLTAADAAAAATGAVAARAPDVGCRWEDDCWTGLTGACAEAAAALSEEVRGGLAVSTIESDALTSQASERGRQ